MDYETSLEKLYNKQLAQRSRYNDKSILKENDVCYQLSDLKKLKSDGRFKISYSDIIWDCLYLNANSKSNRLYVVLNGFREENTPVFKRWSWSKWMKGSVLNIDDPMCKLHINLKLGWYYGDENKDYCEYIVDIVKAIKGNKQVVFYGSSGGGAAVVRCATIMEDSIAVAINPQLVLSQYFLSDSFEKHTGLRLSDDTLFRNNSIEGIRSADKSKFIIIDNVCSKTDLGQMHELSNAYGINKFRLGLNSFDSNVLVWLYSANSVFPHGEQEWPTMFKIIERLIDLFNDGRISEETAQWFSVFSEFWYEHYFYDRRIKTYRRKINRLTRDNIRINDIYPVYSTSEIFIDLTEKEHNKFFHVPIPYVLKENTIYYIKVDYLESTFETKPLFAIKDNLLGVLALQAEVGTDSSQDIVFLTPDDTSEMEMRIYPINPPVMQSGKCIIRNLFICEA